MSEYVHSNRPKFFVRRWTLESRAMFATCYLLFLVRAVVHRVMPWRRSAAFGPADRESIFREASSAAGVLVSSSFMGL